MKYMKVLAQNLTRNCDRFRKGYLFNMRGKGKGTTSEEETWTLETWTKKGNVELKRDNVKIEGLDWDPQRYFSYCSKS